MTLLPDTQPTRRPDGKTTAERGRPRRWMMVLTAALLTCAAAPAMAQGDQLTLDAGVVDCDQTGNLNLDMAVSQVSVVPVWTSAPMKNPAEPGVVGAGTLVMDTEAGKLLIETQAHWSAYDLVEAVNHAGAPVTASVVNTGKAFHVAIAASSSQAPAAFDDTITLGVPKPMDLFDDTITLGMGHPVAVSLGQELTSVPFEDPKDAGAAGNGTLWMTMGDTTLVVDVTGDMNLYDVADAIDNEDPAFDAHVRRDPAGYVLVVNAVSPQLASLLHSPSGQAMDLPGVVLAVDEDGRATASAGTFRPRQYNDEGLFLSAGASVSFDDTITLGIPNLFAFDDTITLGVPKSDMSVGPDGLMMSFDPSPKGPNS